MKQRCCLMLVLCLFLAGCSIGGERIKEPVTFYYVRENYKHDMEQVIVSELREASGHKDDLSYLLALYCMGPAKEDLMSPLPRNTKIIPTQSENEQIELHLSENVQEMTDAEFTLASACISLTCIELTGAQQITVICGERTVTIGQDNLLRYSQILQQPEEVVK